MKSKGIFSSIHPGNMDTGFREVVPFKQDHRLPSNEVHTSKYNWLTFLPLNLAEQLSKPPNLYFLTIGCLQMIPSISPTRGIPTMYIPLSIIICITALKDLYEDKRRSISDRIDNYRDYEIIQPSGQRTRILSKSIRVGMVLRVRKNQILPCDGLILDVSDGHKHAFVSTSNLDGETHLKRRLIVPCLQNCFTEHKGSSLSFTVSCEKPTPDFHQFDGIIHLPNQNYPIDQSNICLRGTKLRNTQFIDLLVLYTGNDTKVLLNMSVPQTKHSSIERKLRMLILTVFLTILFLSAVFALLDFACTTPNFQGVGSPARVVISFFRWVLNLTNLIPISLLVTMETVCLVQGILLSSDSKMYSNNFKPMVNTSNLIEDLGVITCVASDKTGTITKNELRTKKLSDGKNEFDESSTIPTELLQLFAICHSGYVSEGGYESVSQDEVAILEFCRKKGVVLIDRTQFSLKLQIKDEIVDINILHNIQFTSERRKQSIIYEINNKIYLVTKGSDSEIQGISDKSHRRSCVFQDLMGFAKEGLRTMVIATKELEKQWVDEWMDKIVASRFDANKEETKELEEEMEQGLSVVGAVGIEDELQDKVEETVESIVNAGIQFVIISGDRPQTVMFIAANIKLQDEPFLCPNNEYKAEYSQYRFLVFARCTPKDKHNIIKALPGRVLAIGDGANDVSMLTTAAFGVGIAGKEGRAAAQSADIAVGEFKHVKMLLFYYGRETYRKNAYLVTYNFYKNFLYSVPVLVFGAWSSFTGVAIYEPYLGQFYNTFFTAIPIFFYAIFDESEPIQDLENNHNNLYQASQSQSFFNFKSLILATVESVSIGVVASVICFLFLPKVHPSPADLSVYEISSVMMLYVVIFANFRIIVQQSRVSLLVFLACLAGVVLFILFFRAFLGMGVLLSSSLQIFFHESILVVMIMLLASTVISVFLRGSEAPKRRVRRKAQQVQLLCTSDSVQM